MPQERTLDHFLQLVIMVTLLSNSSAILSKVVTRSRIWAFYQPGVLSR